MNTTIHSYSTLRTPYASEIKGFRMLNRFCSFEMYQFRTVDIDPLFSSLIPQTSATKKNNKNKQINTKKPPKNENP
jgi:hypothetical protein